MCVSAVRLMSAGHLLWLGLAAGVSLATAVFGLEMCGRKCGSQARVSTTVMLAAAAAPDEQQRDGWPQIFGPSHNSTTSFKIATDWSASGPPISWRVHVGEGYSAPVASDDDVIVFHRPRVANSAAKDSSHPGPTETVWCLDFATGQRRWEFRHPTNFVCRTHYSNGPYSTPVIDQNHVYALGTEGRLYCLQRKTGELCWMRDLCDEYQVQQQGHFPVASSPRLWNDRIIVNVGGTQTGAGIVALDKLDGRTLWTATDDAASYATPIVAVIHGRPILFVFTREGLAALDPVTGNEHWRVPFRANNPEFVNATTPIVYGDLVFTSGYSLGNLCLRVLPDGSYVQLWRDQRRNLDSQYNPLICKDGWLYGFAALDDTFRCLELSTGKVQWKGLRELERGAAIAAGDHFVVWGTNGHLAIAQVDHRRLTVSAKTQQPLLTGPTYAFPALHRGHLLVRNDQELACVDLRVRGK